MKPTLGLVAAIFLTLIGTGQAVPSVDTIKTTNGDIRITAIFHASVQIEYRGLTILVDPVSAGTYTKKADYILVTHPHPDHYDRATIKKLWKPRTRIILPVGMASGSFPVAAVWKSPPGSSFPLDLDNRTLGSEIAVNAVPMYNLVRGPKPGTRFHSQMSLWNGYVLTLGGKRIYFAGDTEVTPEMRKLKNIDAAFLPMNLPYTMTPAEAAAGARAFKPKRVYPYHYRYPFDKANDNVQKFAAATKGSGIEVKRLEFYPAAALKKALAKK